MKMTLNTFLICGALISLFGCEGEYEISEIDEIGDKVLPAEDDPIAALPSPELPEELLSYDHELPPSFSSRMVESFDNTPLDNPITDEGATLGRVLFYDQRLSQNGTVSCASCHRQGFGFSDPEEKSEGFDGGETGRHSMPLINLRYYARGSMFWDERANTLEEQVLMPVQDEVEMGLTLDELVERLTDDGRSIGERLPGDGRRGEGLELPIAGLRHGEGQGA